MAINLFTRVSGIGPAKARELVNLGITTIAELRKCQDKLTHHQRIGLKFVFFTEYIVDLYNIVLFEFRYFEDFELKIPRKEISKIEKILRKCIKDMEEHYTLTICGSYR